MNKQINVLSIFDGISCGQIALQRAGIEVKNYFASEVDKHAIKVTQHNWPNTVQLGDATKWREWGIDWESIDLLTAGFPCQAWSLAGKQKGTNDPRGALAITLSELFSFLKEKSPNLKFLFENVKMKKDHLTYLNNLFGIEPIEIDSALVSPQNRKRLYWSNIEGIVQPIDKKIFFHSIKENGNELRKYKLNKTPSRIRMWASGRGTHSQGSCANITNALKCYCLTSKQDRCPNSGLIEFEDFCRYMSQTELEIAQTLPVGYTKLLSYPKACDNIGNGWTVDVISHIFSFLLEEFKSESRISTRQKH
jgi:hypothetical protein